MTKNDEMASAVASISTRHYNTIILRRSMSWGKNCLEAVEQELCRVWVPRCCHKEVRIQWLHTGMVAFDRTEGGQR